MIYQKSELLRKKLKKITKNKTNFLGGSNLGNNVLVDNYSELPWDSFDEISSKVNKGDIDLGLFIDTSRQWLTKSPDAPRISYFF